MANLLTVGSLFSGIGGIELGLERTGGFKTIWQSEIDPYASAVLRKHWPGIPNLGDITKINWDSVEKPDLICGGFPCQDISTAGKRAGIKEGTRSGLWFEYLKAIRSLRPRFALVENVSAISNRGLDIVLAGLAEAGYDAEWFTLQAAQVGAPHRRERLFIICYADNDGCSTTKITEGLTEGSDGNTQGKKQAIELERPSEQHEELAYPQSFRFGAFKREWCSQLLPEEGNPSQPESSSGNDVPYSSIFRQQEQGQLIKSVSSKADKARQANRVDDDGWWAVEPDVGRVAHGVSSRVDRLKCLGNAVVPQVAQVIGEAILEMEEGSKLG